METSSPFSRLGARPPYNEDNIEGFMKSTHWKVIKYILTREVDKLVENWLQGSGNDTEQVRAEVFEDLVKNLPTRMKEFIKEKHDE